MTFKILVAITALLALFSFIIGMQVTNGPGSADERVGGSIFILFSAGFAGLTILLMLGKIIFG